MKKIIIVMFLTASVILSSCINLHPLDIYGVFESEFPYMRINKFHGVVDFGEIISKDGEIVKIIFGNNHGCFSICEYFGDEYDDVYIRSTMEDIPIDDVGECLYSGDCRRKDDSIILTFEDGTRIVLNKVADEPENIEEYVNGFMTSDD